MHPFKEKYLKENPETFEKACLYSWQNVAARIDGLISKQQTPPDPPWHVKRHNKPALVHLDYAPMDLDTLKSTPTRLPNT